MASFSGANLAGSFMAYINPDGENNWLILQYGLFGMPVFMAFLAYVIVRYKAFNIRLLAAQALVVAIVILIASQFAFIQVPTNQILTGITLAIVSIFGWWLVRSVKTEVRHRQQLAKLNHELRLVMKQRENLQHLVTHKIKGVFTRSKCIFAEMIEGTFGQLDPKLINFAKQGLDSDNEGVAMIDLVLNSANLESGLVKYNMQKLDLKDIAKQVVSESSESARAKGLKLKTSIKTGKYPIYGDAIWLKEVVHNLVDNSIKYTPQGEVAVSLEKKNDKILLTVKDTGVGLTDDDKENLFKEGGRGKDSLKINVNSTGYGLFMSKMIVEAHQGRLWAESAGRDKGSSFLMELPSK